MDFEGRTLRPAAGARRHAHAPVALRSWRLETTGAMALCRWTAGLVRAFRLVLTRVLAQRQELPMVAMIPPAAAESAEPLGPSRWSQPLGPVHFPASDKPPPTTATKPTQTLSNDLSRRLRVREPPPTTAAKPTQALTNDRSSCALRVCSVPVHFSEHMCSLLYIHTSMHRPMHTSTHASHHTYHTTLIHPVCVHINADAYIPVASSA